MLKGIMHGAVGLSTIAFGSVVLTPLWFKCMTTSHEIIQPSEPWFKCEPSTLERSE